MKFCNFMLYYLCLPCSWISDLTTRVDGKGSGTDELPTTPKSKHSAMEQRRRNKINDRQVDDTITFAQCPILHYVFRVSAQFHSSRNFG